MPIKLISVADIKQCISMKEAIAVMKQAFLQLASNEVIQPLRTSLLITKNNGVCITMPAYLQQEEQLGVKIVSSFPNNILNNQPNIHGTITLIDAHTGIPLALMDASYLTALRTGAISGLATDLLAKKEASTLCIIGTGLQAHTQLEAITTVRSIKQITVWSRNPKNAFAFAQSYQHQYPIEASNTLKEALNDADIICTATNSNSAFIHSADIKNEVHINAIGSHTKMMHELSIDVIKNAQLIVDQKEAALSEAGEIIKAIEENQLHPNALIELGHALKNSMLLKSEGRTVFKSVGLAIQDISIASTIYKNACQKNLGFNYDLMTGHASLDLM